MFLIVARALAWAASLGAGAFGMGLPLSSPVWARVVPSRVSRPTPRHNDRLRRQSRRDRIDTSKETRRHSPERDWPVQVSYSVSCENTGKRGSGYPFGIWS